VISLGQPLGPDCELGKAIAKLADYVVKGQPQEKRAVAAVAEPNPAPARV